MRKQGFVLGLAMFMALSALSALAQRVSLHGRVTEAGVPVQGAEVVLVNPENGQKYTLKTDKKGEFINIGIAYGIYQISVLVNGQKRFEEKINMNQDQEKIIDLKKESEAAQERAERAMSPEQRKKLEDERAAQEKQQTMVKNLNTMLAQAKTAEDSGNYDQAVQILTQATQADPNRDLLWAKLGSAYLSAGSKAPDKEAAKNDYAQAAQAYEKAVGMKPNDGGYHNNLGQAYAKSGKTDGAIKEYNTAAQLDPPNAAMYYYNLGAILTNSGKIEEANQAFDKAIAADPNKADAYYWKGVNLLSKATLKDNKMVAPPGTAEALNKYLELQPNGQYAAGAKQLLEQIGAKVETGFGRKKSK